MVAVAMPTDWRSEAARRANETRKANERDARINEVVEQIRALEKFTSRNKDRVRGVAVSFLSKRQGPVADLHFAGRSARALVEAGCSVISAENGKYQAFDNVDKSLLPAALARMAEGYEVHYGDFADILPMCRSAFFDACGPLFVDSPSADMVRRMATLRLDAFAITVMLSRVEGLGGGKDRSTSYYLGLAKVVLAEDAPAYRIRRVVQYRGEANVPFALFLCERHACTVDGCDLKAEARSLCNKHYNQTPDRLRYKQSPEYKARERERYLRRKQAPEYQALQRERNRARSQTPQHKEWAREHARLRRQTPEYREWYRQWERAYRQRRKAVA